MRVEQQWHDRAAILSIGDELVRGQIVDTNSKWLSARLMDLGIEPVEHVTIPDDRAVHADTLRRLSGVAPLIISTGGLGPTADDLTRDALCDVLGEQLVIDDAALKDLEAKFAKRGRAMTDMQRLQAMRPMSGRCLDNPFGTAPGLQVTMPRCHPAERGSTQTKADVFCLPGPPGELIPMFERLIVPSLRPEPGVTVRVKVLKMIGIGEGDAAKRVGALMDRTRNPLVGITASGAVVSWRIRYRGTGDGGEAERAIAETEAAIRTQMGVHIYGEGDETPGAMVVRRLKALGRTLGVVESCTGGMIGAMVTDAPGASAVFRGGLLTYANDAKVALAGVSVSDLEREGAVSASVARGMAMGGLDRLGVDHCLAVTGVAGPDGGTADKPVGTVWIAHAWRADGAMRVDVRKFSIPGSRADVRERSARTALGMIHLALEGCAAGTPTMLFQVGVGGR